MEQLEVDLDRALPRFRRDLELIEIAPDGDGNPMWALYDAVRTKFYRLTWSEATLHKHLRDGITVRELMDTLQRDTTLRVTPLEVHRYFQQAENANLLEVWRSSQELSKELHQKRLQKYKKALLYYLFIRIPILSPDRFLERTLPYVRPLGSTWALRLYALITVLGVTLLFRRFDEFWNTFTFFFSPTGFVAYALTLTGVKFVHEFSHAYVAKNFGVRVPTMGVAFIVFWPLLYTDVTDSWKLKKRSQRFAISFAGVAAELVIAGLASLGWALVKPGVMQSVFFLIASLTWVMTLLLNLNPAMRFDGYYLLSDLWGIDNLQSRAFRVARWRLRKALLGLDLLPPMPGLRSKRIWGMVVYSVYTWIYRLFLYTTIALVIYFKFTKSIGILLFLVEIAVFIVLPVVSEVKKTYSLRGYIKMNRRFATSLTVVSLFFLWVALPWPHMVNMTGVVTSKHKQIIVSPMGGELQAVAVKQGDEVAPEQLIVKVRSTDLEYRERLAEIDRELALVEARFAYADDSKRTVVPAKIAELQAKSLSLEATQALHELGEIRAKVGGTIVGWDSSLKPGSYVHRHQILGEIADENLLEVVAFLPESQLDFFEAGAQGYFSVSGSTDYWSVTVITASQVKMNQLTHPQVASIYGGNIPVQKNSNTGNLDMVESLYFLKLELSDSQRPLPRLGASGTVHLRGPWRSWLSDGLRFVHSLIWQESGI